MKAMWKITAKESLEECTIEEMNAFIDMNIRTTGKRGKPIKINTFKWSKATLIDFLEENKLGRECINWLNSWYYDLPGYSAF